VTTGNDDPGDEVTKQSYVYRAVAKVLGHRDYIDGSILFSQCKHGGEDPLVVGQQKIAYLQPSPNYFWEQSIVFEYGA
jgi:hypothetical protein